MTAFVFSGSNTVSSRASAAACTCAARIYNALDTADSLVVSICILALLAVRIILLQA